MFKHEIFCNEKDWDVVYEEKTGQYHLEYSGNPDLHIHVAGLRQGIENGRSWLHKHVGRPDAYQINPIDNSIDFGFSEPSELTKYVKVFGINAPSENLLRRLSETNRNGRDTKSNT